MKYFDKKNNRLVYISKSATPEFWDECWEDENLKKTIQGVSSRSFVHKKTGQYLKLGSKILEGGCGRGQYVYALQKWGYEAYGVDFAPETVKKITELFPEMKIVEGDVRALPYEDNFFDAYWSFGVIEHFFEGFEKIASEMKRVVRPGGFIFVTFPAFSSLRSLKARRGQYPNFDENNFEKEKFYQFALDPKNVVKQFEALGFISREVYALDGIKGMKDEVKFLKPLLQYIYNSKLLPMKVLREVINRVFRKFSGHSTLCIFEVMK